MALQTCTPSARPKYGPTRRRTSPGRELLSRAPPVRSEFASGKFGSAVPSSEEFCALRVRKVCRSEEHTSELQSLMRISYAVFCLKKKKKQNHITRHTYAITNSTIRLQHSD